VPVPLVLIPPSPVGVTPEQVDCASGLVSSVMRDGHMDLIWSHDFCGCLFGWFYRQDFHGSVMHHGRGNFAAKFIDCGYHGAFSISFFVALVTGQRPLPSVTRRGTVSNYPDREPDPDHDPNREPDPDHDHDRDRDLSLPIPNAQAFTFYSGVKF
jgi:hypothetical protein